MQASDLTGGATVHLLMPQPPTSMLGCCVLAALGAHLSDGICENNAASHGQMPLCAAHIATDGMKPTAGRSACRASSPLLLEPAIGAAAMCVLVQELDGPSIKLKYASSEDVSSVLKVGSHLDGEVHVGATSGDGAGSPADHAGPLPWRLIRVGHQQLGSNVIDACPAAAGGQLLRHAHGNGAPVCLGLGLGLASVAIVLDGSGRVLMTRRAAEMRTFPRAWVMPGGRADASDRSLSMTAQRELLEETGLRPDQMTAVSNGALCIWESCFPVRQDEWEQACASGRRTAHILTCFFAFRCHTSSPPLALQPSECDAAVWVPLDSFRSKESEVGESSIASQLSSRDALSGASVSEHGKISFERASGSAASSPISAALLQGVYPNRAGEGIGRGHLWALRRLASQVQC
uniref:Nudix hydrolase domain-containing protein n=1 Tax=Chrysotila carterae TaxID=13221 RepID=A0A7S4FBB5_CHRCT